MMCSYICIRTQINLASPASVSSDGMLTLSGSRRVNASVSGSVRLSSTNGDIVLSAKAVEIPAVSRLASMFGSEFVVQCM